MNRRGLLLLLTIAILLLITAIYQDHTIKNYQNQIMDKNKKISALNSKLITTQEKYDKKVIENESLFRSLDDLEGEFEEYKNTVLRRKSIEEHEEFLTDLEIDQFLKEIPIGRLFNGITYRSAGYGESLGKGGLWRPYHGGLDMWAVNPTIYPIGAGTSVKCDIDKIYGKYVMIQHTPRVRTLYAHASKIFYAAVEGEQVTTDTKLMIMGDTGLSDGIHLHFEIQIKLSNGKWMTIDPEPFVNFNK